MAEKRTEVDEALDRLIELQPQREELGKQGIFVPDLSPVSTFERELVRVAAMAANLITETPTGITFSSSNREIDKRIFRSRVRDQVVEKNREEGGVGLSKDVQTLFRMF